MVESLKLHGQVIISTLVLQLKTKDSIASRVDILLVSKDKTRIINIELNPKLKKTTNNKNLSYLFKLAAEYYKHNDKDKYLHDIDVIQVNLNGYYHQNKDILISKYTLYDKQDIYNDLSLFTCTSYKEIAMEAREQGFSIEETSKFLKIDQNIIKRALKKDN